MIGRTDVNHYGFITSKAYLTVISNVRLDGNGQVDKRRSCSGDPGDQSQLNHMLLAERAGEAGHLSTSSFSGIS